MYVQDLGGRPFLANGERERLKKALFAPFLDDYYLLLPNDSNYALVPNKRFF